MQLVAVDIGNSSIKIAAEHPAQDARWSRETIIRDLRFAERADALCEIGMEDQPAFWSVSSVNGERDRELAAWVSRHRPQDRFHLIQHDEIDLATEVESRQLLGRDRLIAAWQALQLNETGPLIVVDAGTAVTVDVVDRHPRFLGGIIFPGANTMFRTLANQTAALPDLSKIGLKKFDPQRELEFIGRSTENAILLGVYQNQICTIRSAVKSVSKILAQHSEPASDPPAIFLTGGGMEELLPWLPTHWQHVPDLILQGALNLGRRCHF